MHRISFCADKTSLRSEEPGAKLTVRYDLLTIKTSHFVQCINLVSDRLLPLENHSLLIFFCGQSKYRKLGAGKGEGTFFIWFLPEASNTGSMATYFKLVFRLFAALAICLLVCELRLYSKGYTPEDASVYSQYAEYDPVLGWLPLPGGRPSLEAVPDKPVMETIWPNRARVSRSEMDVKADKRVIFLGCSHTYGMGIADKGTFVWKLGERFPNIAFDNYAVYGYGTYQALLRERQLLENGIHYDAVIYCPMNDHGNRNIYPKVHMGDITSTDPYVLNPLVKFGLYRRLYGQPPVVRWPLDGCLVTVNFAKRIYFARWLRQVQEIRSEVIKTKEKAYYAMNRSAYITLLQKMYLEAAKHGVRFAVFALEDGKFCAPVLAMPDKASLSLDDISAMDGAESLAFPYMFAGNGRDGEPDGPKFHINGEVLRHPNEICHASWAKHIGDWLEQSHFLD